jgi:hypothetical protein
LIDQTPKEASHGVNEHIRNRGVSTGDKKLVKLIGHTIERRER